ncbi:nuclear body protein SP140-like protein isoform X2 [Kryptolebias marmoratus]|uniref:nuclear body protein SP140-like protein isoform X2 n=1 Tax=Kryptolebias marmoratus TaxID=37003 RepID=UPI0007F8DF04|nr:nuclear body protein SP140-like protein isoform X2 [Kryptolebias marmoratus]
MDPLDFFEPHELLCFFHRRKTEMSCMANPHTFLSQLRDHNLIQEDTYKKVIRMKSKEKLRKEVYKILDWLETTRAKHIRAFWKCVFVEVMLSQYPTLKTLRNSLMDGSYKFDAQLPEKVEKEEEGKRESPGRLKDEETRASSGKKRKARSTSSDGDEQQPGPSSLLTPASPLKKGEKGDIWTWPIYKSQLPVMCGDKEGTLRRDRLAKGEKCILAEKRWFAPSEFEKFAGKGSYRNWKSSIRCMDTPLGKLIKDGHLTSVGYKGRHKQAKAPQSSSSHSDTVSEEEDNQEDEVSSSERNNSSDASEEEEMEASDEQQPESNPDYYRTTFKVTCGALSGSLNKKRFASGRCGKSIRTDTSWLTPVEFVKEAFRQGDGSWRKDIEYDGKPLSSLLQAKVLVLHSLLCSCKLCKPKPKDLDDQRNDDECFICKTEDVEDLVECDHCPRSFHQKCHMPHIEDAVKNDVRPWMCTFCVFNTNQVYRYADEQRSDAVLSRQISQHILECQYLLLYLCSADVEQMFALNPTLYIENYSSFIKTPMWLGNIAEKLKKKEYLTVGQFVSDVDLIFTNCALFNQNNEEFRATGEHLKHLFDQEFKKAFNICD